jgi:hypothetical protein
MHTNGWGKGEKGKKGDKERPHTFIVDLKRSAGLSSYSEEATSPLIVSIAVSRASMDLNKEWIDSKDGDLT